VKLSRCVGAVAMLSSLSAAAAQVAPELWDRPRSAAVVMAQDAVRQAVAAHQARAGSLIVIVHGAGQEAQIQAEELRSWLLALAVDGARLSLRAEAAATGLRIEVSD